MLSCNSFGRSAKVVLAWIALMSRSRLLGRPFEAAFSATIESIAAETNTSCITSVADLVMRLPYRVAARLATLLPGPDQVLHAA